MNPEFIEVDYNSESTEIIVSFIGDVTADVVFGIDWTGSQSGFDWNIEVDEMRYFNRLDKHTVELCESIAKIAKEKAIQAIKMNGCLSDEKYRMENVARSYQN